MPLEIRENCVSVLGSNNKFDNFLSRTFLVQRNVSEKLAYLLGCKKSIPQLKEMIKKMPSADDRKIVLLEMVSKFKESFWYFKHLSVTLVTLISLTHGS